MATPFLNLYNRFLSKVSDYSFGNLYDADLDAILIGYLTNATPKFFYCKQDLTYDATTDTFISDLTLIEQEILANMMVIEWIEPMLNSTVLLKQVMTDSNFNMTSQANQMRSLQQLRDSREREIEKLTIRYDYQNIGDLNESPPDQSTNLFLELGYGGDYGYDF